jgi:Protein of unknown function (DUF3102)
MTKKNARTLDAITVDIHKHERTNIVAVGKFLNEAREACEHGEWCAWLEKEFEWSSTTADRFRAVADLVSKTPVVGELQLTPTTLYALTELEEEALPAVIDALAKRAKKVFLKVADATEIIDHVILARQHGDFPLATLRALEGLWKPDPWSERASEELKSIKPTTTDGAKKITCAAQRGHARALYAVHGELPPVPDDSLLTLELVSEDRRARMLERLRAAPQPLSPDDVQTIWVHLDDDGDDAPDEDDDDPDDGDDAPDGGDVLDDDVPAARPEAPPHDEPLTAAIETILTFSNRSPATLCVACKATRLSSVDLIAAANFLSEIAAALAGNNNATKIADRAEARSRRNAPRPSTH